MPTAAELLNPQNFQKQFKPSQLIALCDATICGLGDSKEGKDALHFRKGFAKKLLDELHPLAVWAPRCFPTDDVQILPNLDSRSFDAEIFIGDKVQLVETTLALNGQENRIHMEALRQYGYTGNPSDIVATGNKHNRVIERPRIITQRASNDPNRALDLIQTAMEQKAAMPYANSTWIIVGFHDANMRSAATEYQLRETFLDLKQGLFPNHERLFLVGLQGRHVYVDSAAS